jgi:hypothetical protein
MTCRGRTPCEAYMSLVAMRVARPTVDLNRIRSFYEHVVGLPLLWSFADHAGFDGAIFGLPDERAQLELVRSPYGDVPAPTNEDALLLYHGPGMLARSSSIVFDGRGPSKWRPTTRR